MTARNLELWSPALLPETSAPPFHGILATLPLVRRALADEDEFVRFWAVSVLEGQELKERLPILKDAGRDNSDFVAGSAIEKLARISPDAAREALDVRRASGRSEEEWTAALRILLSTPNDNVAQALADAVGNPRMPTTEKPYLLEQLWRLS
jgi:hypothetical protein